MSRRTILRTVIGIAISGVAIWILAGSVDVPAHVRRPADGEPGLDPGHGRDVSSSTSARAAPAGRPSSRRSSTSRTAGCSATRTWAISRTTSCRRGSASSSGATRWARARASAARRCSARSSSSAIVDTVIVVALAALAVVVLGVGGAMSTAVILGAGFVALLVVGLFVAMVSHRLPGAERVTAVAERYPRILELARRLRDGLAVAARPGVLGRALLFSAAAWTASIATFIAGGQAVGIELSIPQAALLSQRRRARDDRAVGAGLRRDVRADRGVDRDDLRHGPRCGVRDGVAGPRDDPGRDVGRRRDRRAAARRRPRHRDGDAADEAVGGRRRAIPAPEPGPRPG